jgi:hypothetical protein
MKALLIIATLFTLFSCKTYTYFDKRCLDVIDVHYKINHEDFVPITKPFVGKIDIGGGDTLWVWATKYGTSIGHDSVGYAKNNDPEYWKWYASHPPQSCHCRKIILNNAP